MTRQRLSLIFAAPAFILLSAPRLALADPCTAPLPVAGAAFGGQVRHVIDGDSLCVGASGEPARWVEVRIADFYAAELSAPGGRQAKSALSRVAGGQDLRCRAIRRSYRVVARCTLDGVPLGTLLRRAGVPEGGRGR